MLLTTCAVVALIWGLTNNLIQKFTPEIHHEKNVFRRFLIYVTSWKFLSAFLLNQCGSLLFYWQLGHLPASQFISGWTSINLPDSVFNFWYSKGCIFAPTFSMSTFRQSESKRIK